MAATPILGSTADGTGQDGKEKKHSPIRGGAQQWRAQRLIRALATVSTEDSNPLRDWTDRLMPIPNNLPQEALQPISIEIQVNRL